MAGAPRAVGAPRVVSGDLPLSCVEGRMLASGPDVSRDIEGSIASAVGGDGRKQCFKILQYETIFLLIGCHRKDVMTRLTLINRMGK